MEIIKDNVELAQLVSTDDCDETMSIECNPDDNANISDDFDNEYQYLDLTEIQYNDEFDNDNLDNVICQLQNIIIKTDEEKQMDLEIELSN